MSEKPIPCPFCGYKGVYYRRKCDTRGSVTGAVVDIAQDWGPSYEGHVSDWRFGVKMYCGKCRASTGYQWGPWHVPTDSEIECYGDIAKAKADGDVQLVEWLQATKGAGKEMEWYASKLKELEGFAHRIEECAKRREPVTLFGVDYVAEETITESIDELRVDNAALRTAVQCLVGVTHPADRAELLDNAACVIAELLGEEVGA